MFWRFWGDIFVVVKLNKTDYLWGHNDGMINISCSILTWDILWNEVEKSYLEKEMHNPSVELSLTLSKIMNIWKEKHDNTSNRKIQVIQIHNYFDSYELKVDTACINGPNGLLFPYILVDILHDYTLLQTISKIKNLHPKSKQLPFQKSFSRDLPCNFVTYNKRRSLHFPGTNNLRKLALQL